MICVKGVTKSTSHRVLRILHNRYKVPTLKLKFHEFYVWLTDDWTLNDNDQIYIAYNNSLRKEHGTCIRQRDIIELKLNLNWNLSLLNLVWIEQRNLELHYRKKKNRWKQIMRAWFRDEKILQRKNDE